MNNISLMEVLLSNINKLFKSYQEREIRPKAFLIGSDLNINKDNFFEDADKNGVTPRIKNIRKISFHILDVWNKSISKINPSDKIECFYIDKNYKVWFKNSAISTNEWEDKTPKPQLFTFDNLLHLANEVNGYCCLMEEINPKEQVKDDKPQFKSLPIDTEIFIPVKKDHLLRIEESLFNRNYLDKHYNWRGQKNELAVFLQSLFNKRFFKSDTERTQIKEYFNKRYSIELNQQFEKSRLEKIKSYSTYKDEFQNLIESNEYEKV